MEAGELMIGVPARSLATEQAPSDLAYDSLPLVRRVVRELLLASPAYHEMATPERRRMAELMVKVCHTAAALMVEEIQSDQEAHEATQPVTSIATASALETDAPEPSRAAPSRPLAQAMNAGQEFSGVAVQRAAARTQELLNAVSFPRFVTELINGVFKAMLDSNITQMHSFVELLNNVSASLDGFADVNVGVDRARKWLVETFPGSFVISGGDEEDQDPDEPSSATVQMAPGGQMPSPAALRTALGLGDDEPVPTGDPDRVLVPLARRKMASQRQQMLATMVMLGMQRLVVDSGRIHAAMQFHIDARSAAEQDKGSMFDFRNTASASGSFGFGPWGVSASMTNTIGYATTEQTRTTEDLNAQVDVNSSVEIIFHTDYLPLNRITTEAQADRIRKNSFNPAAEAEVVAKERAARSAQNATEDKARLDAMGQRLGSRPNVEAPPLPPVPSGKNQEKPAAKQGGAAKAGDGKAGDGSGQNKTDKAPTNKAAGNANAGAKAGSSVGAAKSPANKAAVPKK